MAYLEDFTKHAYLECFEHSAGESSSAYGISVPAITMATIIICAKTAWGTATPNQSLLLCGIVGDRFNKAIAYVIDASWTAVAFNTRTTVFAISAAVRRFLRGNRNCVLRKCSCIGYCHVEFSDDDADLVAVASEVMKRIRRPLYWLAETLFLIHLACGP